jgi:hypothetical protein
MASRYYGCERGGKSDSVTDGSSSTSKTVEVVVDLADGANRNEVIEALENIKNYILADQWPPA